MATRTDCPAAPRATSPRPGLGRALFVTCVLVGWTAALAASRLPRAVSPGAPDRAPESAGRCPTFSWGTLAGVDAWRLTVYRTGPPDRPGVPELVLEQQIHGSAASWTPALDRCLPAGGWYAWEVTALRSERRPATSDPLFFRTPSRPTAAEVERALEVLESWRRSRSAGERPIVSERRTDTREGGRESKPERASQVRPRKAGESLGSAAVSGVRDDPSWVGFGVRGTSASPQTGSAGVLGLSTAPSGDVAGVRAGVQSAGGAAALLEALGGGALVRGVGPAGEVFSVDADGALAATSVAGDGSALTGVDADTLDGLDGTALALLGHDHYGEIWSGGAAAQGLRVDTAATFVASLEGRTTSSGGFGTVGVATSPGGGIGVGGFAQSKEAVGGLFSNSGGGTALAVGLQGATFSVTEDGDVTASAYFGDGSQLTGLVGAGQGCPKGTQAVGIEQDGSLACEPAPVQIETKTPLDAMANPVGFASSIAIDPTGLPVVSYYDPADLDLVVARCLEILCLDATREVVADGTGVDGVGRYNSIAIGSDGLPVVAYSDESSGVSRLRVAHCSDPGCDSASLQTVDSTLFAGLYVSIAVGVDGLPIVSYYEGNDADLEVAHCEDLLCSTATLTTVDAAGAVGKHTSIAIGSDGLPVVSYHDESGGELVLAHCDDVACTSSTRQVVTTLQPSSGLYTSLAIGADGSPVISHVDEQVEDVWVVHCDDLTCSSSTENKIDGGPNVYSALAIGVDGLPIVAFSRKTVSTLWVSHCSDPSCETATKRVVDDPAGNVSAGRFPAIAIGSDGLPILGHSWRTEFNAHLNVVHCANRFCL